MDFCIVAFGPIKSMVNGYFVRCNSIIKFLGQLNRVVVLEFPEVEKSGTVSEKNITFIRLRGNEVKQNRILDPLATKVTFDIFHNVKFQLNSLVRLFINRRYIKNCDVCFVEGALIPSAIILAHFLRRKVVLDTHGMNKRLALSYREHNRLVYLVRFVLWHVFENLAFALSNHLIVVSEEEKDFLIHAYNAKSSKVFVVPNPNFGVSERRHSTQDVMRLKQKWHLQNKKVVTFVGDLSVVHNRDAFRYILEELASSFLKKRPDVVFIIAGRRRQSFQHRPPNLILAGFVRDLSPLLEMSDVFIAPLRVGCGVKTKLLQYLAYGKPIVTTPLGVEGIATEGLAAIMVTDIYDFEKTLLATLDNLEELDHQAKKNRGIFERKFSVQSFDESLRKCLDYVTHDF